MTWKMALGPPGSFVLSQWPATRRGKGQKGTAFWFLLTELLQDEVKLLNHARSLALMRCQLIHTPTWEPRDVEWCRCVTSARQVFPFRLSLWGSDY